MSLNFPASPSVNQTYTSNGRSWIWNGATWVGNTTNLYNSFNYDKFSGDGATVTFTLNYAAPNNSSVIVSVSGVQQIPDGTSYNISSNRITFTNAPPAGTNNIVVLYMTTFGAYNASIINLVNANTVSGTLYPLFSTNVSGNNSIYVSNSFQFLSSNGFFSANTVNANTIVANTITVNAMNIGSQTVNTYIQSYLQQNIQQSTLSPFLFIH